jgi:hypothetical protein
VVTIPDEFSGSWSDSGNMLWYYGVGGGGTTPVSATILLSVPANSLEFEYRRPQAALADMDVEFYLGTMLVDQILDLTWDPVGDGDWKPFSYSGKLFDMVVISANDKLNTDNYAFNLVPIPSALLLLGSGLIPVIIRRFRR